MRKKQGPLCYSNSNEMLHFTAVKHKNLIAGAGQAGLIFVIFIALIALLIHTGRALLEAASRCLFSIAYTIDWRSELIETGVKGEFISHNIWEEMADAKSRILATDKESWKG